MLPYTILFSSNENLPNTFSHYMIYQPVGYKNIHIYIHKKTYDDLIKYDAVLYH